MDYGCSGSIPATDERQAIWAAQRAERGWDDTETWNLDTTFAKFILPRLKRFQEIDAGHPGSLTSEEWSAILGKMIAAFESVIKDDASILNPDHEKVSEGLKLFAEWYTHLWW